MKQRMQGMIMGMVLMLLILSPMAVSAAAKAVAKKIDVEFGGYKIQVNGEDYALKDKGGKTVEPFEYDGELYAPVSRLADAFEYLYTWDDKKGVLNILPANETQPVVQSASGDVAFNNYRTFLNGIEFQQRDALGNVLEPLAYKNNIYLPVDSVLHSLGPNGTWDSAAGIFYFGATKVPAAVKKSFLEAAPMYDNGGLSGDFDSSTIVKTEKSIFMGGTEYTNVVTYTTDYGIDNEIRRDDYYKSSLYSLHNLNSKYKVLSGYVGHVDGTDMENAVCNIYGDEKLLVSYDLKASSLPTQISLSVSKINQVKIEIIIEHVLDESIAGYAFTGTLEQ